jgi:hypothetical protein
MTYRARRRLSLLLLVAGLPAWIGFAWWLVSLFERPHWAAELLIYVGLGIVWALPFRAVFRGVGREAPPE